MSAQPTNSDKKTINLNCKISLHSVMHTCVMGLTLFLSFIAVVPSAHGQAFSDLYEFTSEADGDRPDGLALDAAGNLYGSTYYGGSGENGILFKLDAAGNKTLLYRFKGLPDGSGPNGVVRDAAGNLYGTTSFGGSGCPGQQGCGTVFKVDANGKETILHRFAGHGDGTFPTVGVAIDASGNLYGTTYTGGALATCNGAGCGTVFKVDSSGKETVLYRFRGGADGYSPYGGVILDDGGNLYGTTQAGTVFKVDSAGKFSVIHTLNESEGCDPSTSLFRDTAGNLYGTTTGCGELGGGTVFKLAPSGKTTVVHNFSGGTEGGGLWGPVIVDKTGNIYGTTGFGGNLSGLCAEVNNTPGCGVVFKIDPAGQYTVLHTFDGTDGQWAYYGVIQDAKGDLYGTTAEGGTKTCFCGVVFKVEP